MLIQALIESAIIVGLIASVGICSAIIGFIFSWAAWEEIKWKWAVAWVGIAINLWLWFSLWVYLIERFDKC